MEMSKIELAIENLESGLYKYMDIMNRLYQVNVSADGDFQKKYNGFYRMRQRKPEFYKDYFEFMEANKNANISFDTVLKHFYDEFGRIEASFSSKLLATLNPHMPVWDEFVLQNLHLKKPTYTNKNRLSKTIELYGLIEKWYDEFLTTNESKEMLKLFNQRYPGAKITDVKKIDLILWQTR